MGLGIVDLDGAQWQAVGYIFGDIFEAASSQERLQRRQGQFERYWLSIGIGRLLETAACTKALPFVVKDGQGESDGSKIAQVSVTPGIIALLLEGDRLNSRGQ